MICPWNKCDLCPLYLLSLPQIFKIASGFKGFFTSQNESLTT